MENHRHGEDGNVIIEAPAEPAAEVEAVEAVAEADVEIAKVQAERDIALAKIEVKREEVWQEGRVAQLEGELQGMREMLEKLVPEPEPEPQPAPVIIDAPATPVEEQPEVEAPPVAEHKPGPKKNSGISWF